MEQFDPTTPPSATGYRVEELNLSWRNQHIRIVVKNSNGDKFLAQYSGATALTLMNQLNTANLSTLSLHKRILQRMSTDGFLPAGTVTGVPD